MGEGGNKLRERRGGATREEGSVAWLMCFHARRKGNARPSVEEWCWVVAELSGPHGKDWEERSFLFS